MNDSARVTPFDLVFGTIAAERFPALRVGLSAAGRDPRDRDAFLMVRPVVELLRDLEPEEGLGGAIAAMAAFLHHSYLYWMDGERRVAISEEQVRRALQAGAPATEPALTGPASSYVQLPPLRVWGNPVEGAAAEPLDGWFLSLEGGTRSLLAIFGLHPGRAGFTAVEVAGPRPEGLERADGRALFSAAIPGAAAAGLASIVGAEELLELAWRLPA